jgi:hypothetical protein
MTVTYITAPTFTYIYSCFHFVFSGYGPGYDDIVVHGELEASKFVAFYTKYVTFVIAV